jgi:DNA-binding LacI/PurR family transcriptional regulator
MAGIGLPVEHLASVQGHRRIGFLGPPDTGRAGPLFVHLSARKRLEGFRAAMGRAGAALPLEYVRTCGAALTAPVTRTVAVEMMELASPPRAIEMTGGGR